MRLFPARASYTTLLGMFLPLTGVVSGCGRGAFFPPACTNIDIEVHHVEKHGVNKKAVYLCTGKHITWKTHPDDKSFTVEFVGDDLPFGASLKTFDSDSSGAATTPNLPLPSPNELTVFKYKITITDKQNVTYPAFDPHVIGGG